jgi:hypothetical protein
VARSNGQLAVVVYEQRKEEAYRDWFREDCIRNNVHTFISFGLDFVRFRSTHHPYPTTPQGKKVDPVEEAFKHNLRNLDFSMNKNVGASA